MTDIQLYQRTALPPSRTGRLPRHIPVKSGLKQFGQMLTKFSGDIYDDIVKSRATNEIAEFQGLANTEIEAVDTFVAANPNLSFEEYEKRMDKAVLNMRLASEKPTTREGRFGAQVWMSRNLELAKQRMLTSAEAELSKQELRRSEVLIENFKVNLNYDGLTNHYARMVAAGTYDYETIFGTIVDGKPVGGRLEIELGAMKTAEQKLLTEQLKVGVETQAFAIAAEQGYEKASEWLHSAETRKQLLEAGMTRKDAASLTTDIDEDVKFKKAQADEALEQQKEIDKGEINDAIHAGQVKLPDGTISTDIRAFIESKESLTEDEQEAKWQQAIKEADRKLKGKDIITDSKLRSQLYKDTMGILTGAQTRDDILEKVHNARFGNYSDPNNPIEPTLDDADYKALVNSINAQYEQGYGQMMSKVNSYAEGMLLNPDSLGYIKNAPIRHKTFGDFQEAWLQWVAQKGDQLKLSEIYPEGRKLAATFQISDEEAERQEDIMIAELKEREFEAKGKALKESGEIDTLAFPPDEISQKKWNALSRKRREDITQTWYEGDREKKDEILKELKVRKKGKKLTPQIARRYLDMAGDDIEEAKKLAAADGYRE